MANRRAALTILLFVALTLGPARGEPAHARPQPLSADCPGLRLNEFLPNPYLIDWNGDGERSNMDEWIELYNGGDAACDLQGWVLGFRMGMFPPQVFTITEPISLPAGDYRVFFRTETGIDLKEYGGDIWLAPPDGSWPDMWTYPTTPYDVSWRRSFDGLRWEQDPSPTPGRDNDSVLGTFLPLVLSSQPQG